MPPASLLSDELEQVLDRFDLAWQSSTPPALDQFLSRSSQPAARRELLIELVKIDIDYRWQRAKQINGRTDGSFPARPLLEEYVRRFPELGPIDKLPAELIAEEYSARQCWGDRPGHEEYGQRFRKQANALRRLLTQIDGDLAHDKPRPWAQAGGQALASMDDFLDMLRHTGLLTRERLRSLLVQRGTHDPRVLAKKLLEKNWLTAYQVNQILQCQGQDLVIGPYLVLERLGEGMRGKVYKARHRRMGRMVALKVIRKDLLADPDVVSRFYKEIEAVSQLSHPNVVHAYDAGPAGQTHFLAMEYVEGTDLTKVVKQSGPLRVELACDYVRQVALGLQHAFENRLVHRDIKPANLLLAKPPGSGPGAATVKILDMGLARVTWSKTENSSGTMTPEGTMMGTPDYMAPEQAIDPHLADIRSDLYSLGCTFYYLLTAKVPFPGGTIFQKADMHRWQAALPVEQVRAGVPTVVGDIVRKLMAKRPDERYQTPAELVAALSSLYGVKGGKGDAAKAPLASAVASILPPRANAPDVPYAERLGLLPAFVRTLRRHPRFTLGGLMLLALGLLLLFVVPPWLAGPSPGPIRGLTQRVRVEANRPWQDSRIDVAPGQLVTISATGQWRGQADGRAVSADGDPAAPRQSNLVPAQPALRLLARVGPDDVPIAVGASGSFRPKKGGRLFFQANALAPAGAGAITVDIQGGQRQDRDAFVWTFGWGEVDEENKLIKSFTPLPCFSGAYQGGPELPDPSTGWLFFRPDSAHPGDLAHSAVRRWIAPRDGVLSLSGTLSHDQPEGNGVQARLFITGQGELGAWPAERSAIETNLSQIKVKKGDFIDLVLDCRGDPASDSYLWQPHLVLD